MMFDNSGYDVPYVDEGKIAFILDYDEICYRLIESQYGFFKTSFALTALNVTPDFNPIIPAEHRRDFLTEVENINATDADDITKDHQIRVKEAFYTAVAGWNDYKDCTHYFVSHLDDARQREKLAEDIDRMAHSILPTHLWEPINNLAKHIERLREYGDVIIWTHGRREMVKRTLQQNGLLGLFRDDQIFDKQSILSDGLPAGRKDTDHHPNPNARTNNWKRMCNHLGVLPENVGFLDDTYNNHGSANYARIGCRVHVNWDGVIGLQGAATHHVRNTNLGIKKLCKFGANKTKELSRRLMVPANINGDPYQQSTRSTAGLTLS